MKSYNKADFAERVQAVLDHYKKNTNEVARNLKINNISVYKMAKKSSPQLPNMKLISSFLSMFPEVNFRWFIIGEGKMLTEIPKKKFQPAATWEEYEQLLNDVDNLIYHTEGERWKVLKSRLEKSYMFFGEKIQKLYVRTEELREEIDTLRNK